MTLSVAVTAAHPALVARASELAERCALPLLDVGTNPRHCSQHEALLVVGEEGLSLQETGSRAPGPVVVDFGCAAMRHRRRGGANELLGRAVGIGKKHHLKVLDATAGLGRDAFVLADLGCEVVMCERSPVVAALLRSGLDAARRSEDAWLSGVAQRMQLRVADVRTLPAAEFLDIDVITLDPMFPARGSSAAVKKEMALFQGLLAPAEDGVDLLNWARGQDVARVVVKRSARAPDLAGAAPSHRIRGRAVRYDVYVNRGLG